MTNVYIHKAESVASSKVDRAETVLEKMDDDLNKDFSIYTGHQQLDQTKEPSTNQDSRYQWLSYVEDTLHNAGYLSYSNIHVVLYTSTEGAGFSQFNAGATKDAGGFWGIKGYRSYDSSDGFYGISNINANTTDFPYTIEWYENTVIHEVGHLFDLNHHHGTIRANSNNDMYASPMCTWYVEQKCYSTNNDEPINPLCHDDSGSKDACYHWQQMSDCTITKSNEWLNNHVA